SFSQDLEIKYVEPKIEVRDASEYVESTSKITNNAGLKIPTFSHSSLNLYLDCQKKYEYKYVYNMPDPRPVSWDAIRLGSFIHKVIDEGVKKKLKSEDEFIVLAKTIQAQEDWEL